MFGCNPGIYLCECSPLQTEEALDGRLANKVNFVACYMYFSNDND